MIGSAEAYGGLYSFKLNNHLVGQVLQPSSSSFSVSSDSEKILWHQRLGHPNFTYLKLMFPSLLIN